MYGGGPIGGPRPATGGHPGYYQSAQTRQAIHPCAGFPYSQYHIVVENSGTLYRYGRGDEAVTVEHLEASPWFFKGSFSRVPQKMIQFLQQTRHPVELSKSNTISDEDCTIAVEDQVPRFSKASDWIDGGYQTVEDPPDGDGGTIPSEEDPDQDEIDQAEWEFNTQNRGWPSLGLPHDPPTIDDEGVMEDMHRHPSWAWRLTGMRANIPRSLLGGRETVRDTSGVGASVGINIVVSEGTDAEGEIDTGETIYIEELEETFPVIAEWVSGAGFQRNEIRISIRPIFIYLARFGYWMFTFEYGTIHGIDVSSIDFSSNFGSILELQGSYGDFDLLDAHLEACQDEADSFYGSNPTNIYSPLPVNDLDVKSYPYGPDPDDDSTFTYSSYTGVNTAGYEYVDVSSSDPVTQIDGTFDFVVDWEAVGSGLPAQTAPTQGNRPNFGAFYANAPST